VCLETKRRKLTKITKFLIPPVLPIMLTTVVAHLPRNLRCEKIVAAFDRTDMICTTSPSSCRGCSCCFISSLISRMRFAKVYRQKRALTSLTSPLSARTFRSSSIGTFVNRGPTSSSTFFLEDSPLGAQMRNSSLGSDASAAA
jgi:hypothetical protein